MSIIDQQKELEYYPDDVLAQEMMQPTGIAPSFLVATEIKRRNDMRNSYQMQMNQPPQMSVAEEQAMELQGIPNIDPNMMQQQMMQDPMMQEQMPQNAPMQMKEGGSIRYQSGQTIDPYLASMGLYQNEEGDIVPMETGYGGIMGLGGIGEGGYLFDTDPFSELIEEGFGEGRGTKAGLETVLFGGKAALGKAAVNQARKRLAGSAGKIKDRFKGGIDSLRARLGGTKTTGKVGDARNPGNLGGEPFVETPTSLGGKAVDVILNNPIKTAAITGGAGLPAVIDSVNLGTTAETEEVSLSEEEQRELDLLMSDARINLTNMSFGEGAYQQFQEGSPRDQLEFLRTQKTEGNMPRESLVTKGNTADVSPSSVSSSRSNIMDQLDAMLGDDNQTLRDQQSAALVQLGAGIAAGDVAGGLSAAGKEVSALKAARSAEKLKAMSVMVELNYKQGLLDINEAQNILAQIEILKESVGDPKAEEKIAMLEQELARRTGSFTGTGNSTLDDSYFE
tara:strand:+ start:194 stop:1714 length:1521 start_codon:yes stop_codon:yes gene_type:complete